MWGLLPLYFRLLHDVDPTEIVAQRIIWSLLLILVLLTARRSMAGFGAALGNRRLVAPLGVSALLIGGNWLTYVWAVNQGHVLAASLGYFLNPLVNVALGVAVLKERLRQPQMIAIGVAALGVAILAASAITTLWISLTLALTFAFYGLVRKLTPVAPMTGLGVETALLAPLACAYLWWETQHGGMDFGREASTSALLILAGVVTTAPLVLFAVAAQRLSMATLGLLQYAGPTIQFMCGVLIFGETLSTGQMLSFGLIWVALILFASDGIANARRSRLATA